MNEDFFNESYSAGVDLRNPSSAVLAGIVPHHLLVKDVIASYFQKLTQFDYDLVVLVGPDHFGQSIFPVTTDYSWKTPYGDVYPDYEIIEGLVESGVHIDDKPFVLEHSISSLLPFVKKSLPNAKLVPVILPKNMPEEEVVKISESLFKLLKNKKAIVLASVDFSHYLPVAAADFHDYRTSSIIKNLDLSRIGTAEVDSSEALYLAMHYAKNKKALNVDNVFSSNSGSLLKNNDEPTTSHQFYYFTEGESQANVVISMLFFGDVMLDRGVRSIIDDRGLESFFFNIKGDEDRFFRGVDLIGANLEGVVTDSGYHYEPELDNDFAFRPEDIFTLKEFNFTFFNLANNHALDQGEKGVLQTKKYLSEYGFSFSGCPNGVISDCSSSVVELANKKIGMVGVDATNSGLDTEELSSYVENIDSQVDFTVINVHWGIEYQKKHNDEQSDLARLLVGSGADLIIGHHPHVVQDFEIIGNVPVFYSLGNFIFDQYFAKDTQEGLAVGVNLSFESMGQGNVEQVYLFPFKNLELIPYFLSDSEKKELLSELYSGNLIDINVR